MNKKDWSGGQYSPVLTMGASNHSDRERETHDYYATSPSATKLLLELEKFAEKVWEPSCGEGHISKVLQENGYDVLSTDLIDRGFGGVQDFFLVTSPTDRDIITNPPYKFAMEYTEHALNLLRDGGKLALFLKLTFLEGKARGRLFARHPPKTVYVSRSRLTCYLNGKLDAKEGSAVAYCWYIWEKGFTGSPAIKWFN